MKVEDVIAPIAREYNVCVCYTFSEKDRAFYAGRDIYIGVYDNKEFLLISFFHELGHILIPQSFIRRCKFHTLLIELECWNIGIKKALKRKIIFSDEAIQWGQQQALTYVGHDKRECISWNETYKPLFIASQLD